MVATKVITHKPPAAQFSAGLVNSIECHHEYQCPHLEFSRPEVNARQYDQAACNVEQTKAESQLYLTCPSGRSANQSKRVRKRPVAIEQPAAVDRAGSSGGCSSVVEHWIVAPVVGGSIPLTHPNLERSRRQPLGAAAFLCAAVYGSSTARLQAGVDSPASLDKGMGKNFCQSENVRRYRCKWRRRSLRPLRKLGYGW